MTPTLPPSSASGSPASAAAATRHSPTPRRTWPSSAPATGSRSSPTEPPASSAKKLEASGLGRHFDAVVVSAELGVGKPEPEIFAAALDRLGVAPDEAAMVGDTIDRDVVGASAAGLAAIWLNRAGRPAPRGATPPVEIRGLAELPATIERLSARS